MKMLPVPLFLCIALLAASDMTAQSYQYPATPQRPATDTFFGTKITDNYRWLEDMNQPETKAWLKAQAAYTDSILNRIPGRDSLVATLRAYDRLRTVNFSQVSRKGNRYFYRKTVAGDNMGKVYFRDGKAGREVLLIDPKTFSKTKAYAVSNFTPSEDGRKVVFGLAENGGEVSTLRILNVETQKLYPDSIQFVWGGEIGGWNQEGTGFTYLPENSADPADPNRSTNLVAKYHLVGTVPRTDKELFSRAKYPALGIKPEDIPAVGYSRDYKYILGHVYADRLVSCFIAPAGDLLKPTIGWKRLIAMEDSILNFKLVDDRVYMLSLKGARRGRILVTDARNPDVAKAQVVMPESQYKIEDLVASKDYLFVILNDGINSHAMQYVMTSKQWTNIDLPAKGTAWIQPYDHRANDCRMVVTSWNQPTVIYDYNPVTGTSAISTFYAATTYPGSKDIVVEEVEVTGHDGTMIPLSILYNKNLKKDGSAICFMTGYGAYGISEIPYFSSFYLALMNRGVVIAVTHPRGGSEKGEDWHKAGFKSTKPNTWKDFISSGEWLIKKQYTSPGKLIGEGTSAGGLLIGRAITERPDLFAAAICNVGLVNAVRMEYSANGPSNIWEFGTVKDSSEFRALYEMDAVQHVKDNVKYPAVICVGGMNDPRVVLWQPAKFAAALQNSTTSGRPVLLKVNQDNGHFTEDKSVTWLNFASMFAFALWQAGHKDFQLAAF